MYKKEGPNTLFDLAQFLLGWLIFASTSSFLCILMQFSASTSMKLCGVSAGAGFAGHKMDWSLIRNSVLALYFLCLIPTNTFSPIIHHIVKKDRHRRQTSWGKKIAWCSNLVFLLLWDESCVWEIEFRRREESISWFFLSSLFLC